MTIHAFGCSITQGFALPDVVRTIRDDQGRPLTNEELLASKLHWTDIHLYEPSKYAWPQVLGDLLGVTVENYARRGACFQQIARQCAAAAHRIKPGDTVIVMWTYMSRLSLQWPARTSVPLCNVVDPRWNWRTVVLGFNKYFGLEHSKTSTEAVDDLIQDYIHDSLKYTYLDPRGIYNRYYNNIVLQTMTDGFLRSTGAQVIHLSVETESAIDQLEAARSELDPSLGAEYKIPNPADWSVPVDYELCRVIHDPSIPPAENDMHPSVTHHQNFARAVRVKYFDSQD